MSSSAGSEGYLAERADGTMHSFGRSNLGAGDCIITPAGRDDHYDRIACGLRPWARVADAHVPSPADGGDGDAGEAAEVLQRTERSGVRQAVGDCAFQHDCRSPCSGVADHPDKEQMPDTLAQSAAEIMLSHVSALSHSGSTSDRKGIIGRDAHSGNHGSKMTLKEPLGLGTIWLGVSPSR